MHTLFIGTIFPVVCCTDVDCIFLVFKMHGPVPGPGQYTVRSDLSHTFKHTVHIAYTTLANPAHDQNV